MSELPHHKDLGLLKILRRMWMEAETRDHRRVIMVELSPADYAHYVQLGRELKRVPDAMSDLRPHYKMAPVVRNLYVKDGVPHLTTTAFVTVPEEES